ERLASDVFHYDPMVTVVVGLEVEQGHEVGVLQIETLSDAAQLDVLIAAHQLERHFLAAVADPVVNLTEPAGPDPPLEGITLQRPLSRTVSEPHMSTLTGVIGGWWLLVGEERTSPTTN